MVNKILKVRWVETQISPFSVQAPDTSESVAHQRISAVGRQHRHVDRRRVVRHAKPAVFRFVFLVVKVDDGRQRAGDDPKSDQRRSIVHPMAETLMWDAANDRECKNEPQDLIYSFVDDVVDRGL